jgi:hypothetical protein
VVGLSAGRYQSFIVRVWSGESADATLRGQITHVASHQTVGFTDLQRVLAFIQLHLKPSEAGIGVQPEVTASLPEDVSAGDGPPVADSGSGDEEAP